MDSNQQVVYDALLDTAKRMNEFGKGTPYYGIYDRIMADLLSVDPLVIVAAYWLVKATFDMVLENDVPIEWFMAISTRAQYDLILEKTGEPTTDK